MTVQSIAKPLTLHMHGEMAEKFGGLHMLYVHSAAEAFRLMEANFHQKFYRYLREGEFHIVRGPSKDDGLSLPPGTSDEVVIKWLQLGATDIHIMPVLAGASSKGTWMTVIGAVVVAAAVTATVLSGGTALPASLSALSAVGITYGTAGSIGLALAAGGIIMLMAKATQTDSGHVVGGLFGAPTNTTAQGVPVPIIYGRVRRAGSAAISTYTSLKKVNLS